MIRLLSSNNVAAGDALGGFVSRQVFPTFVPIIMLDQCHCLTVEDIQLALGSEGDKGEFTIVKSGDTFTATTSVPTSTGWVTGTPVVSTITVGETVVIQSDFTYTRYKRIRTGTDGTISGRFTVVHNNPLGGTDCDVADVTNTRYGCMFLSVDSDTYIETINSIALDAEGNLIAGGCEFDLLAATNETQRIADATTAPTGLSFASTQTISGNLTAGNYPLWFKTISSGAAGIVSNIITITQSSGGDQETINIVGRHRRYDDTIAKYRLYGDYAGDTVYGTLLGTATTLPATIALSVPPSGTRDYKLRVVEVNKYGIESQNVALNHNLSIDSAGADQTAPQTPSGVALTFLQAGYASLSFTYSAQIGSPVIFAICEIDGVAYSKEIKGFGTYSVYATTPSDWGDSITGTVYFLDNRGRVSATASTSATCTFTYGDRPREISGVVGGYSTSQCYPKEYFELSDGLVSIITEPGGVTCYYDDVKQFETIVVDGTMYLDLTGWTIQNEVVSGAQATSIEDAGTGVFYIAQGGTRRLKVDTVNKTFGANQFAQPIPACRRSDNDVTISGITYYQAFPDFESGPEPWLAVEGNKIYLAEIYQLTGT